MPILRAETNLASVCWPVRRPSSCFLLWTYCACHLMLPNRLNATSIIISLSAWDKFPSLNHFKFILFQVFPLRFINKVEFFMKSRPFYLFYWETLKFKYKKRVWLLFRYLKYSTVSRLKEGSSWCCFEDEKGKSRIEKIRLVCINTQNIEF